MKEFNVGKLEQQDFLLEKRTISFLIQIIDFQVLTTYETMANDNSNSIYDISLETSKDEDNIVFLTLCLK